MRISKSGGGYVDIQGRDIAMLRGLFESRVMTSVHAAAIHFDGRREAAKKRIQTLRTAGLLAQRPRRPNEPGILILSRKGMALLKEQGILAEYPGLGPLALEKRSRVSDLTIRHELAVMDVKAAFHAVVRKVPSLSIEEFGTWPRLYQFTAVTGGGAPFYVRPDGFIRIKQVKEGATIEHCFYLEVDRSTESLGVLAARAAGYLDYYRSGGFAKERGEPRSAFKKHPFRVLMAFKTTERMINMVRRFLSTNPAILTLAYLSTTDDLHHASLGAIWTRPLDYRKATRETSSMVEREVEQRDSLEQAKRDACIDANPPKIGLFDL